MQLIRVGSVSLEEKSIKETLLHFENQRRPLDLIFHRRSNDLRCMFRLILKDHDEKTPRSLNDYYTFTRERSKFSVVKF